MDGRFSCTVDVLRRSQIYPRKPSGSESDHVYGQHGKQSGKLLGIDVELFSTWNVGRRFSEKSGILAEAEAKP